MGAAYPVLVKDRDLIVEVLEREEAGFARTLRTGLSLLEEARDEVLASGSSVFPGDVAFKLHDTHGFPVELTDEIVAESGLAVDRATLRRGDGRAARARARRRQDAQPRRRRAVPRPRRAPRRHRVRRARRHALQRRDDRCWRCWPARTASSELFLDATPFYAESGGQVGDTGVVVTETGRFEVVDTQNVAGGLFAHRGRVTGEVLPGQAALADDRPGAARGDAPQPHRDPPAARGASQVLGDHVRQQGSYVGPGPAALRLLARQRTARRGGRRDPRRWSTPTSWPTRTSRRSRPPSSEAETMGAIAFFGDKYGDRVRVVRAGSPQPGVLRRHPRRPPRRHRPDPDRERVVHRGQHAAHRGRERDWGRFRRSYEMERTLGAVAALLKTSTRRRRARPRAALRAPARRGEGDRRAAPGPTLASWPTSSTPSSTATVLVARVDGYPGEQLRTLAQDLQRRGRRAVVLVGASDDKVAHRRGDRRVPRRPGDGQAPRRRSWAAAAAVRPRLALAGWSRRARASTRCSPRRARSSGAWRESSASIPARSAAASRSRTRRARWPFPAGADRRRRRSPRSLRWSPTRSPSTWSSSDVPSPCRGRETACTALADDLFARLRAGLGDVAVVPFDERLTTPSAQRSLRDAGRKERRTTASASTARPRSSCSSTTLDAAR